MSKKIRYLLIIFFLISITITVYFINDTYALFETNLINVSRIQTAKWSISVNGTLIEPETESLTIDKVTVLENEYVLSENKLAPGTEGYFEIEIDPTDTDVSIRYDISFDFSDLPSGIEILNISETSSGTLIKTGESTYSNVITLEEIKNLKKNNIRVNIRWSNIEENNETDSLLGTIYNNTLLIPVDITITQYLGESIEEYK